MREEYQKQYKQKYLEKKRIITFPLDNAFYVELSRRSVISNLSTNTYAKSIITTYLNNEKPIMLTSLQEHQITEYIRISRGIANNINQIAYNSNIGQTVDINILLRSLQEYEERFDEIITKLSNDYKVN
jgi:hypothetical protein